MEKNQEKVAKRYLLNCIKQSMWTELEFNEKDIYRKEDLSMSDALILIYRELKRFNDRVERQEIQEIQREANMQGWERAEEEERARKKRRKREKKLKSVQRKLTA